MADINVQGDKTVSCCHGHINTIPFHVTFFKCSTCGCYTIVQFFGTITDKEGNYIY